MRFFSYFGALFILLMSSFYSDCAQAKLKRWRATWWSNPSTTIAIAWHQGEGGAATLRYGEKSSQSTQEFPFEFTVNTPEKGKTYWAQLSGLKPDTSYAFRVKTTAGLSRTLWFKTMPNQPKKINVIAGGDSRNHRKIRQIANQTVAEIQPDFVLFGGDFTASDSKKQWKQWFDDWQETIASHGRLIPLVAARGNHDSESKLGRAWGRAYPKFYHALTFGGNLLRVYTLNSERPAGGDQKDWLEKDLKEHAEVTLKFAQYHKPMRPHILGKSEGQDEYLHWAPLFAQYKVDLAIECDSHMMKITDPLWPNRKGEEGFERIDRGTVYIGEGGWGAPLRTVNDQKSWTRFSGRINHFFYIEIEANGVYRISPIMIGHHALKSNEKEQKTFTAMGVEIPAELKDLSQAVPLKVPQSNTAPLHLRRVNSDIELGYSPFLLSPRNLKTNPK